MFTDPPSRRARQNHPAVVLIHGGGWQGGDRESGSMVALGHALANAGFVAFSIDYRLVKAGRRRLGKPVSRADRALPPAVRWIRSACRRLRRGRHAARRRGRFGRRAPGVTARAQATSRANRRAACKPWSTSSARPISPGTIPSFRLARPTCRNWWIRFLPTPEAKRAASPLLHIDDKTAAFLIFHGDADQIVGVEQSRDFHAALQKAGRQAEYVEFPGAGHGFAGKDWETLVAKSLAFFERELKRRRSRVLRAKQRQTEAPAKPAPAEVDLGAIFQMHYANRVRSFQEQNMVFQNVVLLGDSITEGFDVTKLLPGRRVLNRGIGGDVIGNALPADDKRGILARLDESVFNCSATDVFLLIGINDLGSGHKPDVMEQGYRQILERIKQEAPRGSRTRPIGPALQRPLRQAQRQRVGLQ